jgi:archaellum biogenesis ATPase FlaH
MSKKEIKHEDIKLEASLLKALSNKNNYESFVKCIEPKRLIPITQNLLKDYKKYFDKHKDNIDWELFYVEWEEWHKRDLDELDVSYYRSTVFPLIENADDSKVYTSLLEREASRRIEDVISKGMDEIAIQEVLKDLSQKKSVYTKKDDDVFRLASVDCSVLDASNGLTWFIPSIQASLNSLMPGQFFVVAADSDTGKSAFCISQAVHIFKELHKNKQYNRPILYCTSEDTKEDLVCRFLSNLYQEQVIGGFEEVIHKYNKIMGHFSSKYNDELFIGMPIRSPNDLYKIRDKIEKYNPCIIIIDLLDKLSGSDHIIDLTKLYQEIRGIANDGYPIIGTSQTGNTSYQDSETKEYKHRKWLSDKDLSGSKSGKQGAAYAMLMIGKDDDMPNVRYITSTKKKRGKHINVVCEIKDIYSSYKELI